MTCLEVHGKEEEEEEEELSVAKMASASLDRVDDDVGCTWVEEVLNGLKVDEDE